MTENKDYLIKLDQQNGDGDLGVSMSEGFAAAAAFAAKGSENTKEMKSVHGRAAYYAEQSIGILDGGSVVGKLIFEALA